MIKNLMLILTIAAAASQINAQNLESDEENALVHVLVTDMEDKIRKNDIIHFIGINSKKTFQGISNKEGRFDILLPEGDTYNIKIIGLGEETEYDQLELVNEEGSYEAEITIGYEPASTFTLDDVHFDVNMATLRPESYKALDNLVSVLKIKDDLRVEIAGHTDSDGDEKSNLLLSQARAESVVKYLVSKGISASRLIAKGYGESEPIDDNNTAAGKQKNRRTEARILE
jgi:outer membrane protein OmpA-like peptidoglycan-associated protein